METLKPSYFFHVKDKFFPLFILLDKEVSKSAKLLYLVLFYTAYEDAGLCTLGQNALAFLTNSSVRSIQIFLQYLADLQYIEIIHNHNGFNTYRLLLSPRAKRYIARAATQGIWDGALEDAEISSILKQTLHMPDENSASSSYKVYKNTKNNITPLSPLPKTQTCASVPHPNRKLFSAPAVASPSAGNGRGDSSSPARKHANMAALASESDFERLFAAWPVKKDKAVSRRIFFSKARMRKLPGMDKLLAVVERFKSQDKHWLNGCVPLLSSWLRGDRWLDEPYAPNCAASSSASIPPAQQPSPEKVKQLQDCVEHVKHRPPDPELEAAKPAFEKLLSHFSDGQRKRGPAWGLWSLLFRQGKAPKDSQLPRDGTDVLAFLNECKFMVCTA